MTGRDSDFTSKPDRARFVVKEAYFTLQGEGARTGRPAVFCRFAGCNLWSGREKDRADAVCDFCDTDFLGTDGPGGGRFDVGALTVHLLNLWREGGVEGAEPYVVFTGGEPLLQLNGSLLEACRVAGFEIAIETNGTLPVPAGVDWVCVSPKSGSKLVVHGGDELKLVFPQADLMPDDVAHLDFRRRYLQPKDDGDARANVAAARAYCATHPQWRLSLQTHKLLGIP